MNNNIYIVMHNEGIDGSQIKAVFSNYKNAQTLAEMFNKSSEAGEYNFYYVSKTQVNKYNIADFKLVKDDYYTTLYYKNEVF